MKATDAKIQRVVWFKLKNCTEQHKKILNLQNIANGTIDLNNETISNKEYLYKILLEEVNIRNANKLKDAKSIKIKTNNI